jgi:hypothetical protein
MSNDGYQIVGVLHQQKVRVYFKRTQSGEVKPLHFLVVV